MIIKLIKIIFFTFITTIYAQSSLSDSMYFNIDQMMRKNHNIVIKYLYSLNNEDINKFGDGICLENGEYYLKNCIYVGRVKPITKGSHIFIFKIGNNYFALAWIDKNGNKLLLPNCSEKISYESAVTLEGEVYTYKYLKPGHYVIQINCINEKWLKKLEP
jgi:hypothetical protein